MSPLISAIVPTYNRAHFLPSALRSIARQDYRPIEVIVIDDGSSDNTLEILPEQQKILASEGIESIVIAQKNGGPARARNAGLERAKGEFIGCLDSDDLWQPQFLSTLKRLLDEQPTAGLAFGGYLSVNPDESPIGERPTHLPPEPVEGLMRHPFPGIMDYMPTGTPCILMRRSVLDVVGGFDPDFHIGEDWDLWYRIGKKFDFAYCLRLLSWVREHSQNMAKADAGALADKIRLILKHLPDVTDPAARQEQIRRVRAETVLLQEQLMRERRAANGLASMLSHEHVPDSLRFRIGSVLSRRPKWVGSAYAKFVRTLGSLHRGTGMR